MAKRKQTTKPKNTEQAEVQREQPATVTVTWRVNVKHNTTRYRAGETAEVAAPEVEELLRREVIEPLEG